MSDWTASAYYGGYLADCGPFTGPEPAAPPIPANLPAAAGEIDYLIGVPDAGDPSGFSSGLYVDLYRYWVGLAGASATTAGRNDRGVDWTSANHIFVLWYDPNFDPPSGYPAPATAPLSLVPPSFARGATGSPVGDPSTGRWSGVMQVDDGSVQVAVAAQQVHWDQFLNTSPAGPFGDAMSRLWALYQGMDRSQGFADTTGVSLALLAVEERIGPEGPTVADTMYNVGPLEGSATLGGQVYGYTQILFDSPVPTLQSSDLPDLPGAASLVEGIDYWAAPDPTTGYTYARFTASTAAEFQSATDLTIDLAAKSSNDTNGCAAYTDLEFDLVQIPGPNIGAGGPRSLIDDDLGTTVGSVTVPLGGASATTAITLPSDGSAVSYVLRPAALAGLGAPMATTSNVDEGGVGWALRLSNLVRPMASFLTAPFQYWIPGPARPAALPALRLNQRDDGLGIAGAPPRIGGRSRSVQGARVRRIGGANTYS